MNSSARSAVAGTWANLRTTNLNREVFGGTLALNTYGEYGNPASPEADKIMHGMLETPAASR